MNTWDEADLLSLSALQHYLFCPRQCALIHLEQQWMENHFTAEGRILHENTDKPGTRLRRGVKISTALPIRSMALGVVGIADVVEFHKLPNGGGWIPFPVEYKRGRPKAHKADEVQLCAQALALEEMTQQTVPQGAIFYGQKQRRHLVVFDAGLRQITLETADALHQMIAKAVTPPPIEDNRCRLCSLASLCLPKQVNKSVKSYFQRMLQEVAP